MQMEVKWKALKCGITRFLRKRKLVMSNEGKEPVLQRILEDLTDLIRDKKEFAYPIQSKFRVVVLLIALE